MYKTFFGLAERPFSLLPDPDFLYLSPKHKLARAYLEYGLTQKLGFVVLTGEIGTGKTTLIKSLLKAQADKQRLGVLYQTSFGAEDLLELLLKEFEVQGHFHSRATRLSAFNEFLIKAYGRGEHVVLIVDEAHNLGAAALEELRLLSNLQADKEPLLQVILVGQPNLRERLRQPALRQLAQRVGIHFHLQPLDEEETKEYIRYRLARAGGSGIFTPSALEKIYACTQGVPRRINAWCDLALVAAFAEGRKEIDREFLETVVTAQGETLEGPDRDESGSEEGLSPAPEEQGEQSARPSGSPGDWAGEGSGGGNHLRREVWELAARVSRLESQFLDLSGQLMPVLTKFFSHPPPEPQDQRSPAPPPLTPIQEQESNNEESPTVTLESIQLLPARRSFRKIIGAITGAGLLASLAAYVIYTSLPGKISLRESETPGTSTRILLSSPQEQATSLPASPTHQTSLEQSKLEGVGRLIPPDMEKPTSQEQQRSDKPIGPEALSAMPGTKPAPLESHLPSLLASPTSQTSKEQGDLGGERRTVPPKPETLTPQEQPASDKPSGAEALPATQPDIHSEGSRWSPSISYQVTSRDKSLSKIVATHYPNNKEAGFAAVILANHQITRENLIFLKQTLLLPKLNKNNSIIKLNDNFYYIFYDYYNTISALNEMTSMLKSLRIRFLVRETQDSFARRVYRIYLGGYENEDNLKEALKKTERK